MKNIFESSKTFTAYATIDAGYYMLKDLYKELNKPVSEIEKAIDAATGYGHARNISIAKNAVVILKDIISAKKVIEDDYSSAEKTLNELKEKIKLWEKK